nr:FecR family protein [Rhodohalobacter sp. SW132]
MVGIGVFQFSQNEEGITNLEQQNEEKIITTDEGEVKTLRFSNGSRIILNSNSSVAYKAGLLQDETIEVSLQGEAWFETDHSNSSAEPFFSISTSEGIIRDIGTEFLVSTSKDDTKVILQDGLVEIEYNLDGQHSADQAITSEIIFVEKGEMVQFRKNKVINRESVNPTFYTSWATGYLEFNKTSIYELAEYVEQRFNVKVIIAQNDLQEITLDGAIYFNSLNGLVRSVTDVIGVPAFRDPESDKVFIGNPNGVDD